jgi:hypothetical protein
MIDSDSDMRNSTSRNVRTARRLFAGVVGAIGCWVAPTLAAGQYPLSLTLDAQAKKGATAITSQVTIHVERLMEESRRVRVTDALEHGGYANFVNALRTIPIVGTVAVPARSVDVRYAREQEGAKGRRLVLVADQPLFFLPGSTKDRTGYVLTIVELRFDTQGGVTGRMAGAARVKPTAEGGVTLDDYAEVPVQLTGHVN